MPLPINRREVTPGVTIVIPCFRVIGPIAPRSVIATFDFDPPPNPAVKISGVTWSPALQAFYQYLPAGEAEGSTSSHPITLPGGVRAVTVRVLSWPDTSLRSVPVAAVMVREETKGNSLIPQVDVGPKACDVNQEGPEVREPVSTRWSPSNGDRFQCDRRLGDLPLYFRETGRAASEADSLLVLMPSALSNTRKDRTEIIVSRFTWANLWPKSEVVAVADPSLLESTELNGSWFIHSGHDVVAAIASLAEEKAEARGIPRDRITFYGSSLGGFGAIAAASALPGAHAVAEVPQIYFRNWSSSSTKAVERHLLRGSIEDFEVRHPERLNLPDRLIYSGHIPGILLITNPEEVRMREQCEFMEWVHESGLPVSGAIEQFITNRVSGHKILDKETMRRLVAP